MLNGTKRNAGGDGRARLVAVAAAPEPPSAEEEAMVEEAVAARAELTPKSINWLVIPLITLLSALAGGGSALLLR